MPNWCENQITIFSEDKKVIDHIYNVIMSDDDYNLMGLRPEPEDVENLHNWRLDNWGTKWALSINMLDRRCFIGTHEIWVNAESAWSPPFDLLQYITGVHPVTINCTFQEGGMDFIGFANFVDGKMRVSEGSISDNLPDDFDWDDDDASQRYNDIVDSLLDEHETLVYYKELAS